MATSKSQRAFYNVTEAIKDELLNNQGIKTVTFGDLTDIDLQKHFSKCYKKGLYLPSIPNSKKRRDSHSS